LPTHTRWSHIPKSHMPSPCDGVPVRSNCTATALCTHTLRTCVPSLGSLGAGLRVPRWEESSISLLLVSHSHQVEEPSLRPQLKASPSLSPSPSRPHPARVLTSLSPAPTISLSLINPSSRLCFFLRWLCYVLPQALIPPRTPTSPCNYSFDAALSERLRAPQWRPGEMSFATALNASVRSPTAAVRYFVSSC